MSLADSFEYGTFFIGTLKIMQMQKWTEQDRPNVDGRKCVRERTIDTAVPIKFVCKVREKLQ